ncbi:hypothetical protein NM688_g2898 [Phlebia brevispora]|uniref:Uncharacterized protein n=1 Tax=Phlebia brevispora TaxID=194682 RepID=A0ACC1T7F2_9APHY|nr:hypothetical protein NM688_g2898 [Phlebia brevispora]
MLLNTASRCTRISKTSSLRLLSLNACKGAIESKNHDVNALVFTANVPEGAASVSGPLQDVSVAVKDNICTADMPTTCSSRMLKDFKSPFHATVVQLLREAGATLVGKANCDEFGMGSLNLYSVHGSVVNPYQPGSSTIPWSDRQRRSAGGSSGGSAAAVASGMCHVALGTDTGGSIRLPASYCGIPGFKPSYGIISRWGVVSYADSLDCVGVLGQKVEDIVQVFEILAKYDEKDPSAAKLETREKASAICQPFIQSLSLSDSLDGLRIGIPQRLYNSEVRPSVPVSLPSTPYALSAYYVIATAEASSNLARYDGIEYGLRVDPPPGADKTKTAHVYAHSRSAGFGPEVQRRILLGTYALTAE